MAAEWADSELGFLVRLQRGHDLTDSQRKPGSIPVMGSAGRNGFHDTFKAKGPGIVLGRSGASFGKVHYSPDDYWPHNTALYVTDFQENDELFSYYFLKTIDFTSYNTGSAQPSLNRNHLYSIPINIPPLPEQKAIAHVLGSLDDKIELNRRMNETLEEMAQALFKSWFVDFDPVIDNALAAGNPIPEPLAQRAETRRQAIANGTANRKTAQDFPSSFRFTEELGWIPEGWGVKEANEAADISIGKTPPRKQQEWFSEISSGNIVWVSIKDMGSCGVFINDSSEYLTSESVEKFNVKVIPKGSVILSFKLTVGRVAIADTSLATNEAIAHFTDLKNGLTKEFIYSYLKQFDYNDLGSTSSIATAVNSKIIKAMPVLIPHIQVLAAFSQTCQKWFGLIRNQQYQSQTLAKLRDVLLPKLISGELRIPQAEKMVEEAIG